MPLKTTRTIYLLELCLITCTCLNSCNSGSDISDTSNVLSMSFGRKGEIIEYTPVLKDTSIFSSNRDFTVSIWLKSDNFGNDTTVILSNSSFEWRDGGIYGQRRLAKGITLYSFEGRWGWNIGNGRLHYLYEPEYDDQPLCDGEWHNLSFSHSAEKKEIRLFYDGINKGILSIGDLDGREFRTGFALRIGEQQNAKSGCRSFLGLVDDLNIWSEALSKDQIQQLASDRLDLKEVPEMLSDTLTILDWNIWHGGTHFTVDKDGFDGIERTTELIRESGADIVLMQETYGAGSEISSSLGFYYYEASSTIGAVWGANLSVMSRYPMDEAYMVEERSNYGKNYAFNNGGVKVRLTDEKSIIVFSNWYNGGKPEDLEGALNAWSSLIDNCDNIPLVFGGDYNSESHLDDGIGKSGHSRLMTQAGFTDALREIYPDPIEYPGFSSPRGTGRIDYIYYKGKRLQLVDYKPIIQGFRGRAAKSPGYPSDHLGIISKFIYD